MDFDSLQGRSQTEVDFQTHLPRFLPISGLGLGLGVGYGLGLGYGLSFGYGSGLGLG